MLPPAARVLEAKPALTYPDLPWLDILVVRGSTETKLIGESQIMAWIIFVVLLLFYVLGLFVFHASGPVHILPFVAIAVPLIDRVLVRKYKVSRS